MSNFDQKQHKKLFQALTHAASQNQLGSISETALACMDFAMAAVKSAQEFEQDISVKALRKRLNDDMDHLEKIRDEKKDLSDEILKLLLKAMISGDVKPEVKVMTKDDMPEEFQEWLEKKRSAFGMDKKDAGKEDDNVSPFTV